MSTIVTLSPKIQSICFALAIGVVTSLPIPLSINGEGEKTPAARALAIWRGGKDARGAGVCVWRWGIDARGAGVCVWRGGEWMAADKT